MRIVIFIICLFTLAGTCKAEVEEDTFAQLNEKEQISFYRGYLIWQDYLRRPSMHYDFEQILAGMRAAETGKVISCDQQELEVKIRRFQEELFAKESKENLEDAEEFLAKIVKEDMVELVPGKLYYKQLQQGNGEQVKLGSIPLLTYSLCSYNRWEGEEEMVSVEDPIPISLANTIPGFAQAVRGMHEGEVRKIFIHPDLAYGIHGKWDSNVLLIFEVKVIKVVDSSADS